MFTKIYKKKESIYKRGFTPTRMQLLTLIIRG